MSSRPYSSNAGVGNRGGGGGNPFVIRDIIDSPPQPNLVPDISSSSGGGNQTTTTSASNRTLSSNANNPTSHRPGQPLPGTAGLTDRQRDDLLISPSTASGGANSPDRDRTMNSLHQHQRHEAKMAQLRARSAENRDPAKNLATSAMASHLPAVAAVGAAAAASGAAGNYRSGNANNNSSGGSALGNLFANENPHNAHSSAANPQHDFLSSINSQPSDPALAYPQYQQDYRAVLSKTLFKLEAAERLLAENKKQLDSERLVFREQIEKQQRSTQERMTLLEQEAKTERTSLVQAKHDRDSYKRQYDELLEIAERREQEAEVDRNRWENERVVLRKRVEETAASSKSASQLLDAAQSRIRALEEQLADRDTRLQQLQAECAATRKEAAGYEKRIREGLLVDARISQKWLSEADAAKRDNQALVASLTRAMNLLSRTVEYGPLVTRGALGEGFVFCGADPNIFNNFAPPAVSATVVAANASASVLDSLVRDTNTLMRSAAGMHHSHHHYQQHDISAAAAGGAVPNAFPSIFDGANRASGLRVERLRCESDFWIPRQSYDLLGRLLGWMECACALKITPQVETQLLPALHEWFVVLNAVWRERMEEKVRGAVQHQVQKLERDAEKRRAAQSLAGNSRFTTSFAAGNPPTTAAAAAGDFGLLMDGSSSSASAATDKPWQAPSTVSIPLRRTSERLRMRIDEAKRLAWNSAASSNGGGAGNGRASSVSASGGGGFSSNATAVHPHVQRWSNIAIDALQSILDLEKVLQAQLQKQQQQQQQQQQRQDQNGGGSVGLDAHGKSLVRAGIPVVDAREVEESLRGAAAPVSALQEIAEQLRWNVEAFRDALDAANPEEVGASSGEDENDDAAEVNAENGGEGKKKGGKGAAAAMADPDAKVPLVLLMTVHDIASQFSDAVDDSCVALQRAQYDIDRALNGLAGSMPPTTTAATTTRTAAAHLNESRG